MVLTALYQIDGQPMPVPDENMALSFEDIDAADAGRDESGVMHRIPVRQKVGKWGFCYSFLEGEALAYLLGILPQSGDFLFTHPDLSGAGQTAQCRAYLSGFQLAWRQAGCREVKFNIIEV